MKGKKSQAICLIAMQNNVEKFLICFFNNEIALILLNDNLQDVHQSDPKDG